METLREKLKLGLAKEPVIKFLSIQLPLPLPWLKLGLQHLVHSRIKLSILPFPPPILPSALLPWFPILLLLSVYILPSLTRVLLKHILSLWDKLTLIYFLQIERVRLDIICHVYP